MFYQNQVAKVPYCQWSNIGLCNWTSMSMVRDGPLARSYHPYFQQSLRSLQQITRWNPTKSRLPLSLSIMRRDSLFCPLMRVSTSTEIPEQSSSENPFVIPPHSKCCPFIWKSSPRRRGGDAYNLVMHRSLEILTFYHDFFPMFQFAQNGSNQAYFGNWIGAESQFPTTLNSPIPVRILSPPRLNDEIDGTRVLGRTDASSATEHGV